MKLYFIPPEEGEALTAGKLITENGDVIDEGIMTSVWDGNGKSKNAVQVSVVLLLEAFADVPEERIHNAVDGLLAIEEANR